MKELDPLVMSAGLALVFLISLAGSFVSLWILTKPKTGQEFMAMFKFALFLTMISVAITLAVVALE